MENCSVYSECSSLLCPSSAPSLYEIKEKDEENVISDPTINSDSSTKDLEKRMFELICAQKEAYFRSEQIGSPDMTDSEKLHSLTQLYATKPGTFLARYSRFLNAEFVHCFKKYDADYEVAFYLNEMADKETVAGKGSRKIENRRFEAMKRLTAEGQFFGDEQMRQREPLLYDQMIGQYLTEIERGGLYPKNDKSGTLSGLFMDLFDTKETAQKRRSQEMTEKSNWCQNEKLMKHVSKRISGYYEKNEDYNYDSNIEMTRRKMSEKLRFGDLNEHLGDNNLDVKEEMDEDEMDEDETDECFFGSDVDGTEKSELRQQFVWHMEWRFLSGMDTEWIDYEQMDADCNNDPLELIQRDAEDAYFDSEQPATD